VHALIEKYLRTGEKPDPETVAGAIALSGFKYLPERGPELKIEHKFNIETYPGGPMMTGVIDLVDDRVRPLWINDHKSIGNLQYKKTEEQLLNDTQLGIYGHWGFTEYPDESELMLRHIYYQTKGARKSSTTAVRADRETVGKVWSDVLDTVADMVRFADDWRKHEEPDGEKRTMSFPGTYSACSMFGGCGYREKCGITVEDDFGAAMDKLGDDVQSLEEIEAAAAAKPKTAPKKGRVLPPDAPAPSGKPVDAQLTTDTYAKELTKVSTTTSEAPPASTTTVSSNDLVLFLDCRPVLGPAVGKTIEFESYLEPIAQQVARENGVIDYRLIKYEANALLAKAIRENLPRGYMVIGSFSPSAKVAIEILKAHAKSVVQGF
jgi:hypothetical protein